MDIKQEDVLLFFKLFIFGYIIISPFINNSWLKFMNYTPIKIVILITIVLLSFIDLQLGVLSMVAFLVILINLNKEEIMVMNNKANSEIKTSQEMMSRITSMENPPGKEQMIRGHSVFPIPSDVLQPILPSSITKSSDISQFSEELKIEKFQNELGGVGGSPNPNQDFSPYRQNYDDSNDVAMLREETNVRQTISSFPKPYCHAIEYDPILMSEGISDYELDYHTKPFEEYVKNLTPEMAKQIITE